MAGITFSHEIQVAHRLYTLPGKCQNIHGHSMVVHITLTAPVLEGIIGGWDFHDIKKVVRHYLDTYYDHHLLLNENDPFAGPLAVLDGISNGNVHLPGVIGFDGDPTTENIAKKIWVWAAEEFGVEVEVVVQETSNTAIIINKGDI